MRQSQIFSKTRKEAPRDETAKNAQLLIRGGFINKEMAGVYSLLPLGLKVFNNIESIIREEMNAIGGQEVSMTALQSQEIWEKTGRWQEEPWFKTELANGAQVGLSWTHEEPITNLMHHHIKSYRDLPVYTYQFQTKFRNELRSKSGIIRTREFVMKDLYSFDKTKEEHEKFYNKCIDAYFRIYNRVGIEHLTYRTFAGGGPFSKYSDEFQTIAETGEDNIYIDEASQIAINEEVYTEETIRDLRVEKDNLKLSKAIEVGNIFHLGLKYSEPLGVTYTNEEGEDEIVYMGSYGIGLERLMGTVVEVFSDDKGIVWPAEIAPFYVHLVEVHSEKPAVRQKAEELYKKLTASGFSVLYDDREIGAGEKFNDSDLIGIPYRVIVSEKNMENKEIEITKRDTGETKKIKEEDICKDNF